MMAGDSAGGDMPAGSSTRGGVVAVVVRPVASRTDRDRFIRLPWRIYANDPVWVPPLISEVRAALDPARHPFHEHAEVALFLAWRGDAVVGRIAAILNHAHIAFHEEKAGFFGLFESINDPIVAHELLRAAGKWLHERGMQIMRGPMNLSTNDELASPGVLIDGFDAPPVVLMAHTPAYYVSLLESEGFTKAKDLLAYWLDNAVQGRFASFAERVRERHDVRIRHLDMGRFEADVALVQRIYNAAWEKNWGFVPMTEAEIRHMAKSFRPIVVPEYVLLAFVGDVPVGFSLLLPDYNVALRHVNGRMFPFGVVRFLWHRRRIRTVRMLTLGLIPEYRNRGLDALLIHSQILTSLGKGVTGGECSWILEDNWEMRRGLERMGAKAYKTYRVYEKALPD